MVQVTATDFKANFGKYLNLVGREDIGITKNGRNIAVLTAPHKENWIDEITGIIPPVTDDEIDSLRLERLLKKHGIKV